MKQILVASLVVLAGCDHTTLLGGGCLRDDDCDARSYCSSQLACTPLPLPDSGPCAGGTLDRDTCNREVDVATFAACVGAPGPAGCPYCIEGSCYEPGLCAVDGDCHAGSRCAGGLCRPNDPICATIVDAAAVKSGGFGAGRAVCVAGPVGAVADDTDGDVIVRLDPSNLAVVLTPQYAIARPTVGQMVTVHGTVRWAGNQSEWEIHPVDALQ